MTIYLNKESSFYHKYEQLHKSYPFKPKNLWLKKLWKKEHLKLKSNRQSDQLFEEIIKEQTREELKNRIIWEVAELVFLYYEELIDVHKSDIKIVNQLAKVICEIHVFRQLMLIEPDQIEQLNQKLQVSLLKLHRLTKDYFIYKTPAFKFSKL